MSAAKAGNRAALPGLAPRSTKRRPERVGEDIRHEIASLLIAKVKDPRVDQVCILRVEMSDDLAHAHVYYSVLDPNKSGDAAKGLKSAVGFIRSSLARQLALRVVPALSFHLDRSLAEQEKLERLFQEIKEEETSQD